MMAALDLGTVTVRFDSALFMEHVRMLSVGLSERAKRFHRPRPTVKQIAKEALRVPGVLQVAK